MPTIEMGKTLKSEIGRARGYRRDGGLRNEWMVTDETLPLVELQALIEKRKGSNRKYDGL